MATIDPWFRLLLPLYGPGSNPKHTMNALQLVMFKLKLNWMLERQKDKNEAQRGRNWFIFKKISVKVFNVDRRDTTTHKVRYQQLRIVHFNKSNFTAVIVLGMISKYLPKYVICVSQHMEPITMQKQFWLELRQLDSFQLCKYAKEWADTLAKEDKFEHRPDQTFGENIYYAQFHTTRACVSTFILTFTLRLIQTIIWQDQTEELGKADQLNSKTWFCSNLKEASTQVGCKLPLDLFY